MCRCCKDAIIDEKAYIELLAEAILAFVDAHKLPLDADDNYVMLLQENSTVRRRMLFVFGQLFPGRITWRVVRVFG